ncbi:DNA polymerase III subunit [Prosthecochloris sp. CIB 2401]|uniref:DNA polymerase III subunit n=1 Tax=Prosthecochloris sp. CIB 2401 TaxID=1868325 RepID=UPI00080A97C8|nr:DNA polymerase III subunit delta' [Prosthecochloris sp. CIB 2401]ANT64368.1 DNA polymerase III subunit gamma/tau [Prosthecochloris sp. CIB 2401]
MGWHEIIGQQLQKRILIQSLSLDRLAHAYLFTGPEGSGKEQTAFELAKLLNCSSPQGSPEQGACGVCQSCLQADRFLHPNIEYLFPIEAVLLEKTDPAKSENKRFTEAKARYDALMERRKKNPYMAPSMERAMGILTEQVSELQQKAAFMPASGGRKVFIISQAEKLNPAASNKLLKLLEEPPPHVLFILVSSRPESVLPTIRSRCQVLAFSRVSPLELKSWITSRSPQLDETSVNLVSSLSRGNLDTATELILGMENPYQEEGTPQLAELRTRAVNFLRTLLTPNRMIDAIRETEEMAKTLSRPELTLFCGALLLFFQDITHRKADPAYAALNYPDMAATTDRFRTNFPNADTDAIARETEATIHALKRNANPLLTLSSYAITLKRLIS